MQMANMIGFVNSITNLFEFMVGDVQKVCVWKRNHGRVRQWYKPDGIKYACNLALNVASEFN